MPQLSLFLFGPPRIEVDGIPVNITLRKGIALLAYLAVTDSRHTRDHLASLFWPGYGQWDARRNLSRTLSDLNQLLPDGWLDADRQTACLSRNGDIWVDVWALAQMQQEAPDAVPPGEYAELLTRCQADFLAGFTLPDTAEFDDWQSQETNRLRREVIKGIDTLVARFSAMGASAQAVEHAQRRLQLEPLDEEGHRSLMRLYAQLGQRNQALRQFSECERILEEELGVTPAVETRQLFEEIRAGTTTKATIERSDTSSSAWLVQRIERRRHNLPAQPTSFVGRTRELAELASLLADPSVRLVTILGPGGIGKTRFALAAASAQMAAYAEGVWFVDMAPVEGKDQPANPLATRLIDELGLSAQSEIDPRHQLTRYLRDRQMLIVFDNLEHLLDSALFLSELLAACPHVRLLVTSRERLNLQEEWLYPLRGLTLREDPEDAADSSAVRLFVERARKVQPAFDADRHLLEIVRICRMVEGMPLGIELAAAWLRQMSPAEIADEIERSIDFLAVNLRNVPPRHRSMRAVFDHSWHLLTDDEKLVLMKLSVFRGGCRRQEAMAVTGASLMVLAGLVDKSLVRLAVSGRYELHERLRQYTAEKLTEAGLTNEVLDRHSRVYIDFLHKREQAIDNINWIPTSEEIELDLLNVLAAWQRALEYGDAKAINAAVHTLFRFNYCTGSLHYRALHPLFEQALEVFAHPADDQSRSVQGRLLARVIAPSFFYDRIHEAVVNIEKAVSIAQEQDDTQELAFCLCQRGWVARQLAQNAEALTYYEKAATLLDARSSLGLRTMIETGLGTTLRTLKQHDAAMETIRKSLELVGMLGWPDASPGVDLAALWTDMDRLKEAEETTRKLVSEFQDAFGERAIPAGLQLMAQVYLLQGRAQLDNGARSGHVASRKHVPGSTWSM
jgi:predicted ATPase/DNA-binding SARP family transcriptional activator